MNPDSGPHNYGTRAAALRKKQSMEEALSADQPSTGSPDASQAPSFSWRPSVFCPVTHKLISRSAPATALGKQESVTPVKAQQEDTRHHLVKRGNSDSLERDISSEIDSSTNKFKTSPSLALTQSPSPFSDPQQKVSSEEASFSTASSILSSSSPLSPLPVGPTPRRKPALPKKRKIPEVVDSGQVLAQPSASALRVPSTEAQPQPPAKRLRPDTEVSRRKNHDTAVQNQPAFTSPPVSSKSPELDRSKASNTIEFNMNPALMVLPPNLEELPEPTTIQGSQVSNHEEQSTNVSEAFISPTNHPTHFYSNVLIELRGVRFNLPPFLVDGSRFFQRLLTASESDIRIDECGDISIAELVEKRDVNGNTLYVLDKLPLSLDDFVALLDFMRDLSHGQCGCKNIPFKTLAPVLRAETTLEYTSTSIASWSFYLMWNPSWDATTWDLQTNLMSLEVPFTPLPPSTVVDLIDSIILAHLIGAKHIMRRTIYELASASNSNLHQGVDRLPPQIKTLVGTMREKLQLTWNTIASVPSYIQCSSTADLEGSGSCIAKDITSINARNIAHRDIVHNSWMFKKYWGNPMGGIEALVDSAGRWREKGYCEGCVKVQVEGWNRAKEILWAELDEYV